MRTLLHTTTAEIPSMDTLVVVAGALLADARANFEWPISVIERVLGRCTQLEHFPAEVGVKAVVEHVGVASKRVVVAEGHLHTAHDSV